MVRQQLTTSSLDSYGELGHSAPRSECVGLEPDPSGERSKDSSPGHTLAAVGKAVGKKKDEVIQVVHCEPRDFVDGADPDRLRSLDGMAVLERFPNRLVFTRWVGDPPVIAAFNT